jgi:hypothetical protein
MVTRRSRRGRFGAEVATASPSDRHGPFDVEAGTRRTRELLEPLMRGTRVQFAVCVFLSRVARIACNPGGRSPQEETMQRSPRPWIWSNVPAAAALVDFVDPDWQAIRATQAAQLAERDHVRRFESLQRRTRVPIRKPRTALLALASRRLGLSEVASAPYVAEPLAQFRRSGAAVRPFFSVPAA